MVPVPSAPPRAKAVTPLHSPTVRFRVDDVRITLGDKSACVGDFMYMREDATAFIEPAMAQAEIDARVWRIKSIEYRPGATSLQLAARGPQFMP